MDENEVSPELKQVVKMYSKDLYYKKGQKKLEQKYLFDNLSDKTRTQLFEANTKTINIYSELQDLNVKYNKKNVERQLRTLLTTNQYKRFKEDQFRSQISRLSDSIIK
jgi:hypothetical protein